MATCPPSPDPIIGLARRIARRADEVARREPGSAHDVGPWLRAEEEILGVRLPRPDLPGTARRPRRTRLPQLAVR